MLYIFDLDLFNSYFYTVSNSQESCKKDANTIHALYIYSPAYIYIYIIYYICYT